MVCSINQVSSDHAPGAKNGPVAWVTLASIKSTFSEYGPVAYQIKGNEAYTHMLANLPLHTPLTPRGQKVMTVTFFFSESSHVACQIKQDEAENTKQVSILPLLYTHDAQMGSKGQYISSEGNIAYRTSDIEIVQISIFC